MAESATLGGGWLERLRQWLGPASSPGSLGLEPPGAANRALRRHRSRARALPRWHLTMRLHHVRQAQLLA
eukprot:scaffold56225_cov18-Phaeocystis_antarctica.AAC.1